MIQYGGTHSAIQKLADFCFLHRHQSERLGGSFGGSGIIVMRVPDGQQKMTYLKDFIECHMGSSTSVRNRNHSAACGKNDQQDLVSRGAFLRILNPPLGPRRTRHQKARTDSGMPMFSRVAITHRCIYLFPVDEKCECIFLRLRDSYDMSVAMTRVDKLITQRRRHRSLAVISGPGIPSLEEDGRNPVEPAHSHRPSFGGDYPTSCMLLHGIAPLSIASCSVQPARIRRTW